MGLEALGLTTSRFRVKALGFRALGFRALGFRALGFGFKALGSGGYMKATLGVAVRFFSQMGLPYGPQEYMAVSLNYCSQNGGIYIGPRIIL